jgi:hypothetical protein
LTAQRRERDGRGQHPGRARFGNDAGQVVSQGRLNPSGTVKRMRESRPELFRGRHFRDEIIVLCVRWYLRHPLSYRNLEEMMALRVLTVDHSTIARDTDGGYGVSSIANKRNHLFPQLLFVISVA